MPESCNLVKCPRSAWVKCDLSSPPALQARFYPWPLSVSPISTKKPEVLTAVPRLSLRMKTARSSRTRSRRGLAQLFLGPPNTAETGAQAPPNK